MDLTNILGAEKYQELLSKTKEEKLKADAVYNAKNTDLKLQQEILRQQQNVEALKLELSLASKAYPFEVEEYLESYHDLLYAQSSLDALQEFYSIRF